MTHENQRHTDYSSGSVQRVHTDNMALLSRHEWMQLQTTHVNALLPVMRPYLDARNRGTKDPVMDFLFEYYAYRPSHLLKWSPGINRMLQGDSSELEIGSEYLTQSGDVFFVDRTTYPNHRMEGLQWIVKILQNTSQRKPLLGCHGLHEWAMVFEQEDVRHPQFPLRLGRKQTDDVVSSQSLICTHFDAYRFFTPGARPMNRTELSRSASSEFEQPGCLHTNMDLYKWAFKLFPWVSSELLGRSFFLALDIRVVDMRASPYDMSSIGLEPIKIETESGRVYYRRRQQDFAERAKPVRAELLATATELLESQSACSAT